MLTSAGVDRYCIFRTRGDPLRALILRVLRLFQKLNRSNRFLGIALAPWRAILLKKPIGGLEARNDWGLALPNRYGTAFRE
jgi:hypothetical protein